ncbi:hypothetical protein CFOL_v3_29276 [Cephalotus follicularis]|uniref:Uncharacterized protein n=1 Tax=Cephalotus follicularis TaxID=3775 RepID=A0A1Q3D067_CEPFO|nr:hypothetical protein CFOL_v3_29276 [Cephalotus follicularis]
MGQAFRRVTGRTRLPATHNPSPPSKSETVINQSPPVGPKDQLGALDSDVSSKVNADNVLEEKDPTYDAMLNQMVGRISTKPGGKLEMGEAFVVERYNRPMPKLRNTKPDSDRYEERPVATGTINVAQLRHIMLLHQGKADDHDGPMDIHQIADKFRIDVALVQRILQSLSLPPEDSTKQKKNQ